MESIKLKIKALLAKNTDNGATEQEAIAALQKASELMSKYFISMSDLEDPFLGERCVLKEVPIIKSGYDMALFYAELSELFDCFHYFNRHRIAFFGFEQDTELCAYFYNVIVRTCLKEKDRYLKSDEYRRLSYRFHGKTLAASFVKGFLLRIGQKMYEMYMARKKEYSGGLDLVLYDKKRKVTESYNDMNIKTRTRSTGKISAVETAFYSGQDAGSKVDIIQGINQSKINKQIA
jgi:hypothetical protein